MNIGDEILSKKGNILYVEDIYDKKIYLSCNICSKDVEMFPDLFCTTKSRLNRGDVPCGCGSKRLTSHQHFVRCRRLAEERNFILKGFVGEYVGSSTRLYLYNPKNNNYWGNATYSSLKRGEGCPLEGRKSSAVKNKTPLSILLLNLKNVKSVKDYYKITEDEGDHGACYVYCPVCKEDEFAKAGLCTGVFHTRKQYLLNGNIPCRCSSSPKYTYEQNVLRISNYVKDIGGEFVSYNKSTHEVKYVCEKGHDVSVHYNSLLNDNNGCRECYNLYNRYFGKYEDRLKDQDTLYIVNLKSESESFIKVGRSFDIGRRFKAYERSGYKVNTEILYKDLHEVIYEKEKNLLISLEEYSYNPTNDFKGSKLECFNIESLKLIKHFLSN